MAAPGWRLLQIAACLVGLAACGFQPMPIPTSGEIPPGPGVLTGKSGEFVLYGKP